MKAALIDRYGSPEVLVVGERERPSPGPRDVLVKVAAAGVNPVDAKMRGGAQAAVIRRRFPLTLGMDVSGTVVEVGGEVTRFRPGDEVWSSPTHKRPGTYAEYVAIDEGEVAHKPSTMNHVEAAALPLAALTAWECLVHHADVQPGQKVLIHAGSGGVGTYAIQIAKYLGAYVATTCSGRNVELVKSLGADRVIDYTQEDFDEALRDYDMVLDSLGLESLRRSQRVVKKGGRVVSITSGMPEFVKKYGPWLGLLRTGWALLWSSLQARLFRGVRLSHALRQSDGVTLATLARLVEEGHLRSVIDRVYPLEQIVEAHRHIETGRARGKIVIAIQDDVVEASSSV